MVVRPTIFRNESEVKTSAYNIIDELLLAYFQSLTLGNEGIKTAIILDINLFFMFSGAKNEKDFDKMLCAKLNEDGEYILVEMTDKQYIEEYIDEILSEFDNKDINLTFHLLNLHRLIMFFINHNFEYIQKKYSKVDIKNPINRVE